MERGVSTRIECLSMVLTLASTVTNGWADLQLTTKQKVFRLVKWKRKCSIQIYVLALN